MPEITIVFDSEVNGKSVQEAIYEIDKISPFDLPETNLEVNFYFTTNGGVVSHAFVLADYFRRLAEHGATINVIVTDICYSSGIFFLIQLYLTSRKCKGFVNYSFFTHSRALLHEIAISLHSREDRSMTEIYLEEMKDRKEKTLKFMKKHLTPSEVSTFKVGGDVFLDHDRMAKIFNGKVIQTL